MLREVSKFPGDTIFHFNAWTLGYEEVWMALAAHIGSQIHVDDYKWRLYRSLSVLGGSTSESLEGAALCGFQFGNRTQAGCLTQDDTVRLHSCERGTKCSSLENSDNIVWITPLINHSEQGDIPELGAGGGGGDLSQTHELEITDPETIFKLIELCKHQIQDDKTLTQTLRVLEEFIGSERRTMPLDSVDTSLKEKNIPFEDLTRLLSEVAARMDRRHNRMDYPVKSLNEPYPKNLHPAFEIGVEATSINEDASFRLRYPDGTRTRRGQTLPSGIGTEDTPAALSDTSESEIDRDADKGDETQLLGSVDGVYDLKSQSGSPVSVADSMFDSQVASLSKSQTERSTDSRRRRYRKEIYRALQRDDGHIWGREYSLVSTRSSHDPDDLEL
ncbi:MAG: hypothetical protein Q9215_002948 [Flavoplaca cf. flavocitrina]